MRKEDQQQILAITASVEITQIQTIQQLWSGYGSILRVHLSGGKYDSVIVKNIAIPDKSKHPRGWNTEISNQRKINSYEVETHWYRFYNDRCDHRCRIPRFLHFWENEGERFILLEDLNSAGFPNRKSQLSLDEINGCLHWLANFHATFLNTDPVGLWDTGTYWHLETRPDEWHVMAEGELKRNAQKLDDALSNCAFKTVVHGDAKVANFCFGVHPDEVAAVDFQYVGAGCGMKDVAYFLGSVLAENELEKLEETLLSHYFDYLREAISQREIPVDVNALEQEWRRMYPIAWADFTRFLLGWMPTHQKLHGYSRKMVELALGLMGVH
jgi:aminoglycoside phosphotransferase (APT) family kinase protein